MRDKKRLCIATLDPNSSGGVLSMARFVYSCAQKHGMDPYLVYNSLDRNDDLRITQLIKSKGKVDFKSRIVQGLKGISIGRVFPEFIPFQYILNFRIWKRALEKGNLFHGVGGYNLCCLPFVLARKPFTCWVATPLLEDLKYRLNMFPWPKKIAYKISIPLLSYFERIIFLRSKKILALSHYTAQIIRQRHKISKEKIEVVSFPICSKKFSSLYPFNRRLRNPYLLFIGRIGDPRKNITMLIKAFFIAKEIIDRTIELRLVGDKPKAEHLEFCQKLGIGESVRFYGRIPNDQTVEHYQNALLFIVPSLQEGLCIAALEAMACGTPVISTRCGGPEDFIVDGENGLLVENAEPEKLADAIMKALKDKKRLAIMGHNARRYVLRNHSTSKIEETFLKIFKINNANSYPNRVGRC